MPNVLHTSCFPRQMTQACLIKQSHQLYLSPLLYISPLHSVPHKDRSKNNLMASRTSRFAVIRCSYPKNPHICYEYLYPSFLALEYSIWSPDFPVRLIHVALQGIGDASLSKPKMFQFSRSLSFSNTHHVFHLKPSMYDAKLSMWCDIVTKTIFT